MLKFIKKLFGKSKKSDSPLRDMWARCIDDLPERKNISPYEFILAEKKAYNELCKIAAKAAKRDDSRSLDEIMKEAVEKYKQSREKSKLTVVSAELENEKDEGTERS